MGWVKAGVMGCRARGCGWGGVGPCNLPERWCLAGDSDDQRTSRKHRKAFRAERKGLGTSEIMELSRNRRLSVLEHRGQKESGRWTWEAHTVRSSGPRRNSDFISSTIKAPVVCGSRGAQPFGMVMGRCHLQSLHQRPYKTYSELQKRAHPTPSDKQISKCFRQIVEFVLGCIHSYPWARTVWGHRCATPGHPFVCSDAYNVTKGPSGHWAEMHSWPAKTCSNSEMAVSWTSHCWPSFIRRFEHI